MAGTQQGTLAGTTCAAIEDENRRFSLPEAAMFITACSGALWGLLLGVIGWLLQ